MFSNVWYLNIQSQNVSFMIIRSVSRNKITHHTAQGTNGIKDTSRRNANVKFTYEVW